MTTTEYIASLQSARTFRARKLVELRQLRQAGNLRPKLLAPIRKLHFGGPGPIKPTRANLAARAARLMAYGRTSCWASHDTEYYSACGWDDYQDESRREARREAGQILAALRWAPRGLLA